MDVTVTYPQIIIFRQNARQYILESGTKNNHLIYALNRMLDYEHTEKHEKRFKKKNDDLRVDHALVKDGAFVKDHLGVIEIDPKLAKKYSESLIKLHEEQVQIDPFIAKSIPDDMPTSYYSVFVPFVIDKFPEPPDPEQK